MNFEDRSNTSVQSLLALLRSAQGDDPGSAGAGAPSTTPASTSTALASGSASRQVSGVGGHGSTQGGVIEDSKRRWERGPTGDYTPWTSTAARYGSQHSPTLPPSEVGMLLAQLGPPPGVLSRDAGVGSRPAGFAGSASAPAPAGSAFDGAPHRLLDPFGPVGVTPRGGTRRDAGRGSGSAEAGAGAGAAVGAATGAGVGGGAAARNGSAGPDVPGTETPRADTPAADKGKRRADDMDDPAEWAFTRCLPVVAELLRDEAFVRELRKMKSEQHALERRLWARMEKLKAEHAKRIAGERQVAVITRKEVPAGRLAQWEADLKKTLGDFFTSQVLPTMDGLAARQRVRLVELGVPGLGSGRLRLETPGNGAGAGTGAGAGAGAGVAGSRRAPITVDDDNKSQDESLRREKERVGRILAVLESALAEG